MNIISETTHDNSCDISYAAYILEKEAQALGFVDFSIGGATTLYSHDGSCNISYAAHLLEYKARELGFKNFTVIKIEG